MEQLLLNLYNDISALSFVDILFLILFVILVILVISLISVLKNSNRKTKQDEIIEIPKIDEATTTEEVVKENMEKKTNSDELDLSSITKELENIRESNVKLTPYEEEQEEKAIISYDELLKTKSDLKINYQEEETLDNVLVKKVDMENMTSELDMSEVREQIKKKEAETNKAPVVISYEKEEAFLESLKKLQQMLNS